MCVCVCSRGVLSVFISVFYSTDNAVVLYQGGEESVLAFVSRQFSRK